MHIALNEPVDAQSIKNCVKGIENYLVSQYLHFII